MALQGLNITHAHDINELRITSFKGIPLASLSIRNCYKKRVEQQQKPCLLKHAKRSFTERGGYSLFIDAYFVKRCQLLEAHTEMVLNNAGRATVSLTAI